MQISLRFLAIIALALSLVSSVSAQQADIVFVTQVPEPSDFANTFATFGNQRGHLDSAPRGGDLWIRYRNGVLRNLTQAAGFGSLGQQGSNAIAVRDPAVHWDGAKVIFSMVIGAPTQQYQTGTYYWQLYEVTGLGPNETPVITKVANQPENYNNVMPTYASDDQIIFSTDRPRNGERHLYPQRDEYESTATNTGLWKLNPTSAQLVLLDHAPSGAFHPIIDSYGRVIYTRWDHMQRDQQADGTDSYGGFNFSGESASSVKLNSKREVFPEPRSAADTRIPGVNLHSFNVFFPWMINQDGTGLETLNHVGRHELQGYFDKTFSADPNLDEHSSTDFITNRNELEIFLQIREDPRTQGRYFGIHCPEFGTHASGQVVALLGPQGMPADQMTVEYITHPDTASTETSPAATHSGFYRNPLPLSDGNVVVAHTGTTLPDQNQGTTAAPISRYQYRLRLLSKNGTYSEAGSFLTSGISKQITYWTPDVAASFNGNLWELQPVELVAKTRPQAPGQLVEAPEQAIFAELGVSPESFQEYLKQNDLALIVGRNVTTRDEADVQQPFNLRVPGGVSTLVNSGTAYDVSHLQIFQGDQIRGYTGGGTNIQPGRRVLAQAMHESMRFNPPATAGIDGGVKVAADGSFAALVPARRALTWQLTNPAGEGVVRERLWLTFQPGEIRVCASCHGANTRDQVGNPTPQNPPAALRDLIRYVRNLPQEKPVACDFDGDRKSDFGVVRRGSQGAAQVFLAFSSGAEAASLAFGNAEQDIFLAGDVDRDLRADLTAARALNNPFVTWFARESSTLVTGSQPWGVRGDQPIFPDIDGDGVSDKTIFRPSDGSWWSLRSRLAPISLNWGLNGDIPVASDFDGDGWDDVAIWRPSIAFWAVLQSTKAASSALEDIIWRQWGLVEDHPMPGDYDGDSKSDLAVWRPSDGTWYVCASGTNYDCTQGSATQFGLPGDVPIAGDFDGDRVQDLVVWRPSNGNWYIRRSSDSAVVIRQWGLPGDLPLCVGPRTQSERR